ncbi:MAG: RIP metalloprotease RseP, partial [Pseudomonadota bacterium]
GWTDKHGTRWRVSALPLGGYVQFKGDMNPASVPDPAAPAEKDTFQAAALWKRALIVAAGPVTNLIVAVAIFAAFLAIVGERVVANPEESTVVGGFSDEGDTPYPSAAREAGVELGDRIVAIDGEAIADFTDLQEAVRFYPEQRFVLTLERSGTELDIPVTASRVEFDDGFGNKGDIGLLGVRPAEVEFESQPVPLLQVIPSAFALCGKVVDKMILGISQIVTGQRSIRELGGPLKIGKVAGERLSMGAPFFIEFIALISLNLAFINFLPIPALDGGHLAFYAVEAVRCKPVGPQATEWAYRTGIVLVLTFMVVVTFNDVTSLPVIGGLFGS